MEPEGLSIFGCVGFVDIVRHDVVCVEEDDTCELIWETCEATIVLDTLPRGMGVVEGFVKK